ncbi:response regulator transcription factor [Marinomonas pollencensis]|uniref:Regulatory LuxR family protein n=1 Tax=Marinomonas pollencensis TaxID=491954 RepID=A0A3E0DQK6_9GAMM|nr:response regulator transcription factor [Marinomonas pollencensis]REG84171.1 regulatory LuxR family protein [Marinomonas pollencensis]
MKDALNILCWNTDDAVWNHWQKVVEKGIVLTRVVKLEEVRSHLDRQADKAYQYIFVFLEDEAFSKKVEEVALLRRSYPDTKIVVFPNQPSQAAALRLLSLGVSGQCAPYIGAEQLALVLSVVGAGEIWGGKQFIENLIAQSLPQAQSNEDTELLQSLSEREQDVVRYIAHGLSNKQIASEMDITERTVKSHLTTVFKKTHTKDRLSLALLVQGSTFVH